MSISRSTPITVPVTQPEWEKGRAVFEHQADDVVFVPVADDEAALAKAIRQTGAPATIVGVKRYRGEVYDALPAGGVIARFGVGYDSIDLAQATARRLVVTNTPGALDASVAEHAIWFLGALARPIHATGAALSQGSWAPQNGREVNGLTLAVIGFGRIGRRTARIAGLGLGMRVVAFDCLPLPDALASCGLDRAEDLAPAYGVATYTTDLAEALAEADFVSLHLSVTPETVGFFNRERLALLKPGACLINTARGALIDENALYDALATRALGGAGLDVFVNEPYAPVDPQRDLRTLPNAILTPHIGSSTTAANERMATQAVACVRACLQGRWQEATIVNREVLATLA